MLTRRSVSTIDSSMQILSASVVWATVPSRWSIIWLWKSCYPPLLALKRGSVPISLQGLSHRDPTQRSWPSRRRHHVPVAPILNKFLWKRVHLPTRRTSANWYPQENGCSRVSLSLHMRWTQNVRRIWMRMRLITQGNWERCFSSTQNCRNHKISAWARFSANKEVRLFYRNVQARKKQEHVLSL